MGLKSFRVDFKDAEGKHQVEFFEEDKKAAEKFARKKTKEIETSVFVVFAVADTFLPSEAVFKDRGQKVFHQGFLPHVEGEFPQ